MCGKFLGANVLNINFLSEWVLHFVAYSAWISKLLCHVAFTWCYGYLNSSCIIKSIILMFLHPCKIQNPWGNSSSLLDWFYKTKKNCWLLHAFKAGALNCYEAKQGEQVGGGGEGWWPVTLHLVTPSTFHDSKYCIHTFILFVFFMPKWSTLNPYLCIHQFQRSPSPPPRATAGAARGLPGGWALAYPGVTPEHLTHVFERWMSLSGRTRLLSKTGLSVRD